jgi:hypothetical protein
LAIISLLTIYPCVSLPHRLYIKKRNQNSDVLTKPNLFLESHLIYTILLCLTWIGAVFITLLDIFTFIKMSDEEFDTKYELRRVNFNLLLKILAALLIILGVSGLIVKDRIVCPSQFIDQDCIFLDSNSNGRNSQYAGTRMPGALSRWIINFPPYLLGAGGVLILRDTLRKSERQ